MLSRQGVTISRIRRFGVGQTATVFDIVCGLLFALMIVLLFDSLVPQAPSGSSLTIAFPVLYDLGEFMVTVLSCFAYNLVAEWVGGIEMEMDELTP